MLRDRICARRRQMWSSGLDGTRASRAGGLIRGRKDTTAASTCGMMVGSSLLSKQSAALPAVCVPNFTPEPPSLRSSAANLSLDRGPSKITAAWACGISCLRLAYLIQGHARVCANPSLTTIATLHILPSIGQHRPCHESLRQHARTQ
jgi:hypothetical protein